MITFKQWRIWVKGTPWIFKWFIILLLIRPVADNFYYLKHVSPLLSPLYWIGVLTPVFALWAIFKQSSPKSVLDNSFRNWSLIAFIASFLLILSDSGLGLIQNILKLTMPVYLYFFLRKFVTNRQNVDGLLTTFLYSCFIVYAILLYETFINPIRVEYSRGLERIQGSFADIMNYAIYLSFGLVVSMYFYINKRGNRSSLNKLLLIIGITILGLLKIKHTTTIGVIIGISTIFLWFTFKKNKGYAIMFLLAGVIGFQLVKTQLIDETVNPLIERELEVLAGERAQTQMFHGRMSRWAHVWNEFLNSPVYAQLFGYTLTGRYAYGIIGINVHNDFFRIMFFTGYIGFIFYISFLYRAYIKISKYNHSERFLGVAGLAVLSLYSVTTLPTLYAPMLYPVMIIFAYYALPEKYYLQIEKENPNNK